MKLFGSLKELVSIVFRKNSQEITVRPNQSTTYTANRDMQLPPGDAAHVLVSADSTQTLTNKTLTSPVINTPTGITKSDVGLGNVDNTSDATKNSAVATLTNKTIDGDDNTVQDLPETAIKTNLTNASKFFTRNASGVPESATKAVPSGVVVGTTDSQSLTNKTIVVASNTVTTAASGNLAATELNAALSELQGDIDTRATSASLTSHTGASSGVHGVTGSVVGTTDTQTLTNKTLQQDLVDDYLDFNEESAPGTPASGKARLYVKTDGKFYRKDDAGNEYELGAGGSGELNVVDNPNDTNAGWTTSGGGITVATTTTAGELPLSGLFDTGIKIDPVSGTDYAYYRWTMPSGLKGRKLKLEWHQKPESGYASGDLKVEVYKNSASNYSGSYTEFNLSTDSSGTSSIPSATGQYLTYFDADDADYYELRIVRTAGTNFLVLQNVIVGPGKQTLGAVTTEWASYTPTLGNVTTGSGSSTSFRWRRVGDTMHIQGRFDFGSGGSVSGSITIPVPSGYTIDSAKIPNTGFNILGQAQAYDVSADQNYAASVMYNSSTSVKMKPFTGSDNTWANTFPFTWASTDIFIVEYFVPISEWSGSSTINAGQNDVEYVYNSSTATAASDSTSFAYGPAGAQIQNITADITRRVRFLTPIASTDEITVEVSDNRTQWYPLTSMVTNSGGTVSISPWIYQNGTAYGMGRVQRINTTDVDIIFAAYNFPLSTYGAAGQAWSAASAGSFYWRVKKTSGGVAVGFANADTTVSGLAPAGVFAAAIPQASTYQERTANPSDPSSGAECRLYMKADKLIIQYNDGGTVRYKYLDLTGTGVTWVHTTTPP